MTDIHPKIKNLYTDYPEIPYISPDRPIEAWLKKVKLGTENLVPKRNMLRTQEGLLPGDLILLWRISLGTYTTESWTPKYFEYDYGIDCPASLTNLIDQGYALQDSAQESLDHTPASVLKALLKDKEIKGLSKLKKEEVKNKVLEVLSPEELDQAIDIRSYRLTPKGQAALENNQEIIDRHPKKKL